MNLDELNFILQKGEGTTIEYKEALSGVPKALYETLISFSNTDGGTVVLGADDDGNVLGIDSGLIPKFIKEIVSTINNGQVFKPCLFLEPVAVEHPNGHLIVVKVPASTELHKHNGKVYWRSNDNDQDVTNNQHKVAEIIFQKKEYFSEGTIYPFLTYNDLDEALFDKARHIISARDNSHPWLSMSNQDLLSSACLFRKDFKSGKEGLTLAAALIFGKDSTIHNLLPGYKVDALVRINDKDRHDDRLLLRTNLIDTYIELLGFVKKHLSDKFYQEHGQRKDLRELIFREVIGNFIVHREYTNAHSSEFIIYDTKVTVTNPNKPLFHGPLDLNQFNPYPKNPNIRKFFTAFGWTDELGSGVRNITKYLNVYANGAKPLFIENNIFLTEIPLKFLSMAKFGNDIFDWLEFTEESAVQLKDNLHILALESTFEHAGWQQLILHLVPSWNENGTKLEKLNWPKKQYLNKDEIKKVPSWEQNGTKLLHKKTVYFIKILMLAIKPISLTNLMNYIGYENRNKFRQTYLLPLQSVGFIEKTAKDSNSPDQKYLTSPLGQSFITGANI
ncbi:MAG: putative DNA binding domain-containing protein [Colwellia sp.]